MSPCLGLHEGLKCVGSSPTECGEGRLAGGKAAGRGCCAPLDCSPGPSCVRTQDGGVLPLMMVPQGDLSPTSVPDLGLREACRALIMLLPGSSPVTNKCGGQCGPERGVLGGLGVCMLMTSLSPDTGPGDIVGSS